MGPTAFPTRVRPPSPYPTAFPTRPPTKFPTGFPSRAPTRFPTTSPTRYPSTYPTRAPTAFPTTYPTRSPTGPTRYPTAFPTTYPTTFPTRQPSVFPTAFPTRYPTAFPTGSNGGGLASGSCKQLCRVYRNGAKRDDAQLCVGPRERWGSPCYPRIRQWRQGQWKESCNADWVPCTNEVVPML